MPGKGLRPLKSPRAQLVDCLLQHDPARGDLRSQESGARSQLRLRRCPIEQPVTLLGARALPGQFSAGADVHQLVD